MPGRILGISLILALSACTPFLYGGIVVLGPDRDQPSAESDKG